MADNLKIIITVEDKDLLTSLKKTDALESGINKLSGTLVKGRVTYAKYNKAVSELAVASNRSKKELLAYGKSLRRNEKATKDAKVATKALAAAKKKAADDIKAATKATTAANKAAALVERARLNNITQFKAALAEQRKAQDDNTAAVRRLRMENDAVYRTQQKTLQMKKMLKTAVQNNTMSTEQAIIALKRYNAVQRQSNGVMGNSRNRMNGSNMAIQQMGYQFGDFAVQVQGGTSAFVAFSQQGAQLAGILPMIAGPLGMSMKMAVGLSAALGILIPIGSAVGRMYFEMKDKTKEAAEETETLNGKLKSLSSTLADYAASLEAIASGVSINELFASRGIKQAEIELEAASATLEKYLGFVNLATDGQAIGTMGPVRAIGALVGIGFAALSKEQEAAALEKVTKAEERLTKLREMQAANQAKDHAAQERALRDELVLAQTIAQFGKDSAQAKAVEVAQELRLRLEGVQAQVDSFKITEAQGEALKKQINDIAAITAATTKVSETGQQKALRLSKDDLEIQKLKIGILRSHNAEGEKTRATLTLESHLAGEIVRIKQEQKFLEGGITAEEQRQIDALVAAAIEAEHLNQRIEAGADKAKELASALSEAASAMGQLVNFGTGLDKALAVAVAQTEALRAGQNAANAGRIAGMRFDAQAKYNTAMQAAGPLGDSTITNAASKEFRQQNLTIDGIASNLNTSSGLKDDAKSSNVVNINEIIAARKAQADQDRILLGLSGEEHDAQRIYFQLQKQNEKATIQTSDIKLQGYAKEIAAQREQNRVIEEAAKQQEQLADFIGSSMETAMMSIVDSTISVEDAFKSMAASIIKELYRVLVVQKIVAAAKAFLGFADGGVVQQGAPTTSLRPMARPQANGGVFTKVNAYANGGVVSSPTTFPMSGNQTGLMGEAGAEAIMPLKRGRNGKLGVQAEGNGSGDVININQSFNFQANGDDSVKKLIAQAAPKIAELAKASVIDSRRRGGSTKAAFG